MNPQTLKPFIKWAGGKSSVADAIRDKLPVRYDRYFEPFLGGGAIFLGLAPTGSSVLNDINASLITAWDVVKLYPQELMGCLDEFAAEYAARQDKEAMFYAARDRFNKLKGNPEWRAFKKIEFAALFIFLNKTCFNGLYRENSNGLFNVPFGKRYRCPALYNRDELLAASAALAGTTLLCTDFIATSRTNPECYDIGKGDLVYIDPPYDTRHDEMNFTKYSQDDFDRSTQIDLAAEVRKLALRGAKVFVSNAKTDLVQQLYYGFTFYEMEVTRQIGVGDRSKKMIDVLITNT